MKTKGVLSDGQNQISEPHGSAELDLDNGILVENLSRELLCEDELFAMFEGDIDSQGDVGTSESNCGNWSIVPGDEITCEPETGFPKWLKSPETAALLYPSKHAKDLQSEQWTESKIQDNEAKQSGSPRPNHLIILDGTWPKAKRVYYQNPWLQKLPHFFLSASEPSRYGVIRKEPKVTFTLFESFQNYL